MSSLNPALVKPLGSVERATAIAVGVAAGGGGSYAVFASTNQAGTAILLILSAIFLLIGIQGTPLIRFTTGSNMVELERRRERVEQAVEKAAKDDVKRAEGILEGAALAMPDLHFLPFAEAALYVQRIALTIMKLGYEVHGTVYTDPRPDITVINKMGAVVEVEVKYYKQSPLRQKNLFGISPFLCLL